MQGSSAFTLYIDEAGDEGISSVRPLDENGGSEYFVLVGLLISSHRKPELNAAVDRTKAKLGIKLDFDIHFRDFELDDQRTLVQEVASFRAGLIAVVSNKRNMRGYRNSRVEAHNIEIGRNGRTQVQSFNWFYNHMSRYLLESASIECARWSNAKALRNRKIDIVYSHRKDFRYSQTQAYLHKLQVQKRPEGRYFNNKRTIDLSTVSPFMVRSARDRAEPGLQYADCAASAIYRAIDEDHFGSVEPGFLTTLEQRFIRSAGVRSPAGYGFKLLPDGFSVDLSLGQAEGLAAVG